MSIDELMELSNSSNAPYNHQEYTVWLHNKIIESVNYELWEFREKESLKINNGYTACNIIMGFESLKEIK